MQAVYLERRLRLRGRSEGGQRHARQIRGYSHSFFLTAAEGMRVSKSHKPADRINDTAETRNSALLV
jgi:hypothetical protein